MKMNINESTQKILKERLNFKSCFNSQETNEFINSVQEYLKRKEMNVNTFLRRIDETLELFNFLDFNYHDTLVTIMHYPSIVQANKKDYLTKYLILGSLGIDEENNEEYRKEIMVEHTKYLIIGHKNLYARYKFLVQKSTKYLTRYYLLKMTNQEFYNTFKMNSDELIKQYPFNDVAFEEILKLPENEKYYHKVQERKIKND